MAAPIEPDDKFVFIFDRRTSDAPEIKLALEGVTNFNDFRNRVTELLELNSTDEFVISTTNREEVKDDESFDFIEKGDTLYLLTDVNQELSAPTNERVDYLPHYDTIVKGGMYEYYASEGQNPLPYAFAELIDNSLAATALNDGARTIEMRLMLDDSAPAKSCMIFIDNGKGMTSRQLNNWAIYRLSKFTRREQHRGEQSDIGNNSFNLADTWAPRFMNSDISYFGVGGKQAIFFIGTSARMISKPKGSKDIHELLISKDEFERREKNKQSIYTGYIRNRKPGDTSHVPAEDEHLVRLITEEESRDSFTAVVIQGVNQQHLSFLKHNFKMWTRQLAHIYHYYLHGPDGNQLKKSGNEEETSNPFNNIEIQVSVHVRGNPNSRTINLRDIEDDMPSQFAQTAVSSFDFKAYVDGTTAVEGLIRYHPFLFDRETYPLDIYGPRLDPEPADDHGYAINDRPARGRRPIFETYWNGRLIPYTLINDFDWCSVSRKHKNIPDECFNRISGVLWTNDSFKVSTNKLTFLDLEMKLKDKTTNFIRMVNGHEKRTLVEKEFHTWLKNCSDVHDKQILFSGSKGVVRRLDLPKHKQYPWTQFESVEWDGKMYKVGDMVRILRTMPVLHGTIRAFYLHGELEDNVFGMCGDIEIAQEPRSIYTEVRFVALNKLDRGASDAHVRKYIEEEETKLPDHLILHWPNGLEIKPNEKYHVGVAIGDMKVEICNKKGEKISKMPGSAAGAKKLLVELKLVWHGSNGDETVISLLSQHGKTWPYWFKKMSGTAKQLGSYTLLFQAVLNESGATMYAGRVLPNYGIKFSIIESDPVCFLVSVLDGPFKVGVPFQIPLEFQDEYYNATRPPVKLKPILDADGLELSYETTHIKGNNCSIRGVVAKGTVNSSAGKNFNLKISVPEMEMPQILKIRLLPGPPAKLHVEPATEVELENGSIPSFNVQVQDVAGNITSGGKMTVMCKFHGAIGLPTYTCDCSTSGTGVLTGKPIQLKKIRGDTSLTAVFSVQGMPLVPLVECSIKVLPSTSASVLRLYFKDDDGKEVEILPKSKIERSAGSIVDGLTFRIFNEAGKEIEVDEKMAAKIKVNWSPKVPKDMAMKKGLPSIKVPLLVSEVKYAQVSVAETGWIEVPFNVKARAGQATIMEYVVQGEMTAFKGDALKGSLLVTLKDKHGNPVECTMQEWQKIVLESTSLRTDNVKIQQKNNSCCLSNLIFDSHGMKKIVISFQQLECVVGGIHITSGPPTQLEVMEWTGHTLTAHSDKPLLQPFRVRLLDFDGNSSNTPDIKIHVAKDAKLKLHPMPSFVMTDSNGVADFGVLTPTASSGKYELQPKAIYGKTVINGPKLILCIQPDPHKAKALNVNYNSKATAIAGHKLPDFTVEIVAEDDTVMNVSNSQHLRMSLWRGDANVVKQQPADIEEDAPIATSVTSGVFVFKNCPAPKEAGPYTALFVYDDGFQKLSGKGVSIQVNPSSPALLVAIDAQITPTVSNTRNLSSRTLLKNLCLELRDEHNNCLGEGFNGKVRVEIIPPSKVEEIPVFTGGGPVMEFSLVNGQCILQNLIIQENSPGKDGLEYQVRCTVVCDLIPKNKPLSPLVLPFLFYNDAKKQQQMTTLCRERDTLQNTIKAFQSMFDTQKQLIEEFRAAVHDAQKMEQTLRADLRKQNIPSNQLQSVETVEKLITARTKDREALLAKPRRLCTLPQADNDPQVLGKIAHLALVHQDDIATVLSWHMSADMDCIITLSTQKAKEIYSKTQGKQQVLPLDSIYRKNLPDWQKPLPHVRFRPDFKPTGNPVYARNLLEFTKDEESCRIVFGMLLGDTLILDNLDHANLYRQEIVKYTHCPTILTRSGDRIRSNGKFGGAMNRAPPVEKLKGCVFGQPLPLAYHAVCTQIETLNNYKVALSTHIKAQDELQEQISQQKLPDTMNKFKECKEAENRLKEVERKLGMTSTPARATKSQSRTPVSGTNHNDLPATKRPKIEPGLNLDSSLSPSSANSLSANLSNRRNGGRGGESTLMSAAFDPNLTPARTSLRIASMTTVVSDDGRKKLRKTN